MHVGVLRLSLEEKAHKLHAGLRLYCGEKGQSSTVALINREKPGLSKHVSIFYNSHKSATMAFVDFGAVGNFLDSTLARHLSIPLLNLELHIIMWGLDGNL